MIRSGYSLIHAHTTHTHKVRLPDEHAGEADRGAQRRGGGQGGGAEGGKCIGMCMPFLGQKDVIMSFQTGRRDD